MIATFVYNWPPDSVSSLSFILPRLGIDYRPYSLISYYIESNAVKYKMDLTEEEFVILKLKDPNFSNYEQS